MMANRCPCVVVTLLMTVHQVVSQPTVDGGSNWPEERLHLLEMEGELLRLKQSLAVERRRTTELEKLLAEKNSTNAGGRGPPCVSAKYQTITMNLLTRLNASSPSRVYGVATGRGEILVVGEETKTIRVYEDGGSYAFKREIAIPNIGVPHDIVYENKSCDCFFIATLQDECIWKLRTAQSVDMVTRWICDRTSLPTLFAPIGGGLMFLRTMNNTVNFVSFYSTNGTRTRDIRLPDEIQSPFHVVQTSRDTFIVSHPKIAGSSDTYSVLTQVDSSGRIINQFFPTDSQQYTSKQVHLGIDLEQDVLFVADVWKFRVLALDAESLDWIGPVISKDDDFLQHPFRLAFDAAKRRLLVGQWASRSVQTNPSKWGDGRVDVYQVRIRNRIVISQ